MYLYLTWFKAIVHLHVYEYMIILSIYIHVYKSCTLIHNSDSEINYICLGFVYCKFLFADVLEIHQSFEMGDCESLQASL